LAYVVCRLDAGTDSLTGVGGDPAGPSWVTVKAPKDSAGVVTSGEGGRVTYTWRAWLRERVGGGGGRRAAQRHHEHVGGVGEWESKVGWCEGVG
jgi:hypothetical protein